MSSELAAGRRNRQGRRGGKLKCLTFLYNINASERRIAVLKGKLLVVSLPCKSDKNAPDCTLE